VSVALIIQHAKRMLRFILSSLASPAIPYFQPLTEMSTRNISWGVKAAGAQGWQPYHLHVIIVLKSGSLNLLEPSGPVQACNGIALRLPSHKRHDFRKKKSYW